MSKPATAAEYLSALPTEAITAVNEIRAIIKSIAPAAEETSSYGIGAFKLNGKAFIYYAGFKKHTSIYPAPRTHKDFLEKLKNYKGGKGTVQFPLNEPLPTELIKKIVLFRLKENEEKWAAKK